MTGSLRGAAKARSVAGRGARKDRNPDTTLFFRLAIMPPSCPCINDPLHLRLIPENLLHFTTMHCAMAVKVYKHMNAVDAYQLDRT